MKSCYAKFYFLILIGSLLTSLFCHFQLSLSKKETHHHLNVENFHNHSIGVNDEHESEHVHKHRHSDKEDEHEHSHSLHFEYKDFYVTSLVHIIFKNITVAKLSSAHIPKLNPFNYCLEILRPPILKLV